jgi:eukaryotic-like serine/threonine-protein kinase
MADHLDPVREPDRAISGTRSATASADARRTGPEETARAGAAATALAIGEQVGRYRVRRLIGEGGMGRVYLARDTVLGRSVALKVIRPERVSARDVDRFIVEARATARLNHPHIVVLYDVGEHRGAPYLALEYLDGESLRERAGRERMSVDEALRVARAAADALDHACSAGVRHCDLKPSNVVLPRDGRLRVVDFGLALLEAADSPRGGVAGTPSYMAPEQWLGEALTDRVDVWALAVMTHEILSGEHPFGPDTSASGLRAAVLDGAIPAAAMSREGVPSPVIDLLQRSLRRDPAARPSAAEWRLALDGALAGAPSLPDDKSPYRGLSAFGEADAHLFFGREPEIEAFLERLRTTPTLPIAGPSGAGKSSFLHAGVIPRLRARERWRVIALRPGSDPFTALAHGLLEGSIAPGGSASSTRANGREAASLAADLRATPTLLGLRLSTLAATDGVRVLLAIDQLEELFTQGASEEDVQRFLHLLASTADDPAEPVRVAVTLRDDFLGRIPAFQQLFVLKELSPDELRRTIMGPLSRADHRFEDPSIVDDILREIGDIESGLPLLQFACRALWDARDPERRLLLAEAYRQIGGVAGALARHADRFLAELSPPDQRAARQILVRLVAGTSARRVVERRALLADLPDNAPAVLDRLLSARLVVQRRARGEDDLLVELTHESLLQRWTELARWIDESREERRLLDELEEASSLWEKRGRRPEETWSPEELGAARRRIQQLGISVPAGVEAFLAEGERRHAAARRRSRWQLAGGAVVAVLVTAGSLALASQFRRQKIAAEEQAESLRLAGGNLGQFDLVLQPFDWIDGAPKTVSAADLPALSWRLHGPSADNVHRPGAPMPAELVRIQHMTGVDRVEAPGGMAFLRIDGRGRAGESCAPSWLRLQSLPGFATRGEAPRTITIAVPTCKATLAGMVEIPAGPFIYGGPGDPPTKYPDYAEPEEPVTLERYFIDRTEVSNAAFKPFIDMASISGYSVQSYPYEGPLGHAGDPPMPATGVDAFEAEAFCRYMGKQLPSDHEWAKAARGGLVVNGAPNPAPRRLFPWGTHMEVGCANTAGTEDGARWVVPVDGMPCGASPYGALNMAGNVAEWISREGQLDQANPLRVVRGGAADSPPVLEQTTTIFRNAREGRHFDFAIGVRCVMVDQPGKER